MVTVPIHQDTSSVPLMTTLVIDITDPQSDSTTVLASMPTTTATVTETTTTTTTVPPPASQPQQDVSTSILIQTIGQLQQNITDLVDANQALEERLDKQGNRIHQLETQDLSRLIREQTHAMRAPLRARFKDLLTSDMKEILLQRILEENYDKGHEDHKMAVEALQKSIIRDESEQFDADKAEERTKKKSKQDSPKTPSGSPPPPPSGASGASGPTRTSNSAQDPPPPPPSSKTNRAWTTTTSRLKPTASSVPEDVLMHEESDFKAQDMGSDDENSGSRHIPKMEECHKLLTNQVDEGLLGYNVSRPLPLGGPPSQVTIQTEFFFNKDLEYLRFGHKGDRLALSITKMKAASYPDAGLEQMVPNQMWAEEEYMYDISASYGISHWWFKRQQFYIDRHSADTNRRAIVRTHMRILSVVRIEVLSLYGYDYMKKIVLRRADNQEYTIAESDFKDLYPSDFEDLYLLNLEGQSSRNLVIKKWVEDFQLGIESYQTQLNLTKPRWEATSLEFMHDYKILDSPQAVVFRDKYGMQMIMRFNKIHKFSDGTQQQIDEALDYRVKEFKVNKVNPGLNTRFWTKNDAIKSKQFMFAIQKRLKLRRIFRNLESFVGGHIRERDYRLLQRTR
ncbi:hypothetical protein Tco_1120850 [Tanacetum coccineum]|uniref:Uncharacterized protein n=1 Tax=Tanacetum coccineum TaxID=301880 RepID=A0ABQ5IXH6_9ASTR